MSASVPPPARPTRRRLLQVVGAVAAAALPLPAPAPVTTPRYAWRGAVLGAEASIVLYHPEARAAAAIVGACLAEVERLEAVFSLYRADSELSRLNRDGALAGPSQDFVRLLDESLWWGEATGGAFDVSVQPLWRLHAEHFARFPNDRAGPEPDAIAAAKSLVDYRRIIRFPGRVRLGRPGMALTFNGIAQGYIADRVAELLESKGIRHVLLDLGEMRALGSRADGAPWRVALRHHDRDPVELMDCALATSAPAGLAFDAAGRHHHLFDPATGSSAHGLRAVSVLAPRATTADALSTALAVAGPLRVASILGAANASGRGRAALLPPSQGARGDFEAETSRT